MQLETNPHASMIGKPYRSKKTGDIGTVTDVVKQPRDKVFMNMRKYRKEYHVLMDMQDGNQLALHNGYPLSIFKAMFAEVQ